MSQIKERPILFSAPMVRAILEGRKTQTRRIVKPQPPEGTAAVNIDGFAYPTFGSHQTGEHCHTNGVNVKDSFRVPYGKPGERLWVRENFWVDWRDPGCVIYSQDQTKYKYKTRGIVETRNGQEYDISNNTFWKQKPSIFMPRWASRITLEVTGVHVERLQQISEADAAAEGVERNAHLDGSWEPEDGYLPYCSHYPDGCECFPAFTARDSFKGLWFKINGEESWDANPWVWVVEFKRVDA